MLSVLEGIQIFILKENPTLDGLQSYLIHNLSQIQDPNHKAHF